MSLDFVAEDNVSPAPIFRWAGSKRKLIPKMAKFLPASYERYVEPFAGSACLFFHLQPKKALISDINPELINAYDQIKNNPIDIICSLKSTPERSAENYYRIRAMDPTEMDALSRAVRFIYLNRLCFNGLYRTNMKGQFNVPYGGEKTGNLPTDSELLAVSRAFANVTLAAISFDKVIEQTIPGDFVYLDPPYSISNRRVFNNYSNEIFGIENLRTLRQLLLNLDNREIPFLLSYGMSAEGRELAVGFKTHHALVQRQISGFSAHRRKAREMLITNY